MTATADGDRATDGGGRSTEYQRVRILRAAVKLAGEAGFGERVPVVQIVRAAGVSRPTFYALFDDWESCLSLAIEEGVALAEARVAVGAKETSATWVSRMRGGLRALLELGEEEPELARLCVVRALVDTESVGRLDRALEDLERVLDEGRGAPGAVKEPPKLAARGILGGALGAAYARLISDTGRLVELESGLMAMIVLPYLGAKAARKEERGGGDRTGSAGTKPGRWREELAANGRNGHPRMTYRTMRVLEAVAERPGMSNLEVARQSGIVDQGQVSKLLSRLAGLEWLENTGAGQLKGTANSWTLTERGELVRRVARPARAGAIA